MTKPGYLKIIFTHLRYLILTGLPLISSCAHQYQHPITIYPTDADNKDLVDLGRNPDNKDQWLVRVREVPLVVLDTVPIPALDSMHLLNHTRVLAGERVLDIGTGTGIQAIFAARNTSHVVATDINPQAGVNARLNINTHGLEDRIDVRVGDLFAPLSADERFDVILLNLRYPQNDKEKSLWHVHERFFAGVKNHLNPGGRIYYQFGYMRNEKHVEKMLADNQLYISEKRFGRSTQTGEGLFITFEIKALPKKTIR